MIGVAAPAFTVSAIEPAKSSRFNRRLFGSFKPRAFASLGKASCDCVQRPLMMAIAKFGKIRK